MTGLRFPREMAVFGTHDFKPVPSTLWWLMACDPLWFMASRRRYFLGCKSWTACFPHQLPTVIVSASSALSKMLVNVVKEENGELGERMKEKVCSITNLLLTQGQTLNTSLYLCSLSFSSSWSSLSLFLFWGWIHSGSLRPLEGMVWKKKTVQWPLLTWQWSYAHLSTEPAVPDSCKSQVHAVPCNAHLGWITVLKQMFISMHLIYTFFSLPLSTLAT